MVASQANLVQLHWRIGGEIIGGGVRSFHCTALCVDISASHCCVCATRLDSPPLSHPPPHARRIRNERRFRSQTDETVVSLAAGSMMWLRAMPARYLPDDDSLLGDLTSRGMGRREGYLVSRMKCAVNT